jgi:hypothetical protein
MDWKGKVPEPVLEQKELGYAYCETGSETNEEHARHYTKPVSQAKRYDERHCSQT